MNTLPFGPLTEHSLMVCIDMQRLFLEPGEWYAEPALSILPHCEALAKTAAGRCLFTRFITAQNAREARGSWQRYYRRWQSVTRDVVGNEIMQVHSSLAGYASEERSFDKSTHDAFDSTAFSDYVHASGTQALVLMGIETDVCVLATALSAVDLGYRVIIVKDAVASSVPESHTACLTHIYPRFDQQIELVDTATLIDQWTLL